MDAQQDAAGQLGVRHIRGGRHRSRDPWTWRQRTGLQTSRSCLGAWQRLERFTKLRSSTQRWASSSSSPTPCCASSNAEQPKPRTARHDRTPNNNDERKPDHPTCPNHRRGAVDRQQESWEQNLNMFPQAVEMPSLRHGCFRYRPVRTDIGAIMMRCTGTGRSGPTGQRKRPWQWRPEPGRRQPWPACLPAAGGIAPYRRIP